MAQVAEQKWLSDGNKELISSLKSLDAGLKENEQIMQKYEKLRKKIFSGDANVVDLKKKKVKEIQKMYTEINSSLSRNEKLVFHLFITQN